MKTRKVGTEGWDEIKTTCVRFDGFVDKSFFTVGNLVESNKRLGKRRGTRCQFCHDNWTDRDADEDVALVQTTKGNKLLCEDCVELFEL